MWIEWLDHYHGTNSQYAITDWNKFAFWMSCPSWSSLSGKLCGHMLAEFPLKGSWQGKSEEKRHSDSHLVDDSWPVRVPTSYPDSQGKPYCHTFGKRKQVTKLAFSYKRANCVCHFHWHGIFNDHVLSNILYLVAGWLFLLKNFAGKKSTLGKIWRNHQ